jgi:hypothetical protein
VAISQIGVPLWPSLDGRYGGGIYIAAKPAYGFD